MATPIVEARGTDIESSAVERSAAADRAPILNALEAIERSVSSVRIIPLFAIVVALWWGQVVLIPLVLSVLISYALEPVIASLVAWHIRRALAVPLLLAVVIASVSGGAFVLRGEAVAFVNRLAAAAHTVAQAIQGTSHGSPGTVARVQQAARELETAAGAATTQQKKAGVTAVRIEEPTFKWSDWLWQGSRGALEFAGQMFVVACLVYYLLVSGDMYKRKLVRIVPTLADKKITVTILEEVDRQVERFLLARLVISSVVGILIWVAFRLLGVEEAGLWGVLASLLFAIPIVGPTLIVMGAAVAGFVQFGSLPMAGALAAVCTVIGVLEGYVLTPWLMSRVGEMNPVAVFVSLLFWGWIWGGWGLLLAVPITAAAKAVCERVEPLNAFAELLKT